VSNKFFDSIAAGRPVFANFTGFSTKIAEECGAGFILPRDHGDAASRLLDVINQNGLLARARVAATTLARERFARDMLAERLEEVLERTVRQGRRP
jgi:hypothetical protein